MARRVGLRWGGAGAIALALAVLLGARARGATAQRLIRYDDDALTVRLTNVPVADVLDEVCRQTGAAVIGQPSRPDAVSAEFEAVPLGEALHRLLGEQNFALIFTGGGRLRTVRLFGAPDEPAGPPSDAAGPARAPWIPPQVAAANLGALLAHRAPVPVGGRLAPLLGSSEASLAQLVGLLRQDDADVRAEALRTTVTAVEADPPLLAAVAEQLDAVDDGALPALLGSVAGEHEEEIAMQILTQARANELRVKASSILQQLRAGS